MSKMKQCPECRMIYDWEHTEIKPYTYCPTDGSKLDDV